MAKSDVIDDVNEVEYDDDDDGDDRDVIIMDSHCLPRGWCERNELLPTYTIIKTQQWMRLHKFLDSWILRQLTTSFLKILYDFEIE